MMCLYQYVNSQGCKNDLGTDLNSVTRNKLTASSLWLSRRLIDRWSAIVTKAVMEALPSAWDCNKTRKDN